MAKAALTSLVLVVFTIATSCDNGFFWAEPNPQYQPRPTVPKDKPVKPSDKKFKVRRDGFRFSNYTERTESLDLTPRMVERLCGPSSCARGKGRTCVLSGAMEIFKEDQNRIMSKGHCEGMNALAQAILLDHVDIRSLDEDANNTFELPFVPDVQEEIAFWCATQSTRPARFTKKQTPSEIVDELMPSPSDFSMVVCKKKGKKRTCHSLTPIRVLDSSTDPDEKLIHVYDSNAPGNNQRFVSVDMAEDSFSYGPYKGAGRSFGMYIKPFSNRIVPQKCPVQGNENNKRQPAQSWQVHTDGPASVIVPKGTEEWPRADAPPLYIVKPGKDQILTLRGQKDEEQKPVRITILSEGLAKTIDGIVLDPKEEDVIHLGSDDDTILYKSKDGEKLVVSYAATYKGADYILEIAPSLTVGFELFVENRADDKKGEHQLAIKIKSKNAKEVKLKVMMKRIGSNKDATFIHRKDILMASGETATLEYGRWLKDKQPLSMQRDIDSDGYTDREQLLSDDE